MTVIKPHLEHYFVLLPELVACLEDGKLEGANMADEWVFKTFVKAMKSVRIMAPDILWAKFKSQIKVHSVFGSAYEDLRITSAMWNQTLKTRAEYERYPNKAQHYSFKADEM